LREKSSTKLTLRKLSATVHYTDVIQSSLHSTQRLGCVHVTMQQHWRSFPTAGPCTHVEESSISAAAITPQLQQLQTLAECTLVLLASDTAHCDIWVHLCCRNRGLATRKLSQPLLSHTVCPSVCPWQLESMELSIAANFAARRYKSAFFTKLVQGTHVWYIFGLFRLFLINWLATRKLS